MKERTAYEVKRSELKDITSGQTGKIGQGEYSPITDSQKGNQLKNTDEVI